MTALPTEPGSVIGWCLDGRAFTAAHGPGDLWWTTGDEKPYFTAELAEDMKGVAWWYMGRVTPDGITTTR